LMSPNDIMHSSSRAELIRTAITFLQTPRVISASEEKKRLFLKSKSLSDEEIELAVKLAALPPISSKDSRSGELVPSTSELSRPRWSIGSTGLGVAIFLFAGVSYGLYSLYLAYVVPFIRRQKKTEEKLALLEESVRALKDNVNITLMKMRESVERLEVSIQGQSTSAMQMEARLKHSQSQLFAEVRSEVTSLKGVLLDVRNFPVLKRDAPSSQSKESSSISSLDTVSPSPPAWQLQSTLTSASTMTSSSDLRDSAAVAVNENPYVFPSVIDVVVEEEITANQPDLSVASEPESSSHDVGILQSSRPKSRLPPSTASRSASSSGSSATSFEVIETRDCASLVINRKELSDGNVSALAQESESAESDDSEDRSHSPRDDSDSNPRSSEAKVSASASEALIPGGGADGDVEPGGLEDE